MGQEHHALPTKPVIKCVFLITAFNYLNLSNFTWHYSKFLITPHWLTPVSIELIKSEIFQANVQIWFPFLSSFHWLAQHCLVYFLWWNVLMMYFSRKYCRVKPAAQVCISVSPFGTAMITYKELLNGLPWMETDRIDAYL